MTVKVFRGSKGKGKSGSSPVRTPDTLRSADTVDLILALGEGPWKGLKDGAKSFYVGDTALENASGESNFDDFTLRWYPGSSPDEKITPALGGIATSKTVNQELTYELAVTRTGLVKNIDYLEARLVFQQLYNQDSSGDVREDTATFVVEYKPSLSSTWTSLTGAATTLTNDARNKTTAVNGARSATDDYIIVDSVTNFEVGHYLDITWQTSYVNDRGVTKYEDHQYRRKITSINTGTNRLNFGSATGKAIPDNATVRIYAKELIVNNTAGFVVGKKVDVQFSGTRKTLTIAAINSTLKMITVTADPGVTIPAGAVVGQSVSIKGKTTSTYVWELRWPVTRIDDTYDIRIMKTWPPESGTSSNCSVSWESFQEVITGSFNFPDVACVHVTGKATDQFSSLPDFWGIYQTRLIKIPTNYDPVTRTYSGSWDGTFKIDYCNNPSWVLYDFVMNDQFGMNAYYPIVMDKWDCYEAGQWCDQMVSDGKGGLQPRYTFNAVIADARSAKEMAQFIAGTFGGVYYDDGNGTAHLRVDKDDDAVALFTKENIIDGLFEYSFTDIMTRVNRYTVSFINPDLNWKEDRRTVSDDAHIAQYGLIPDDFVAVGCTNLQEALRRTRYKLKTGTTEKQIVSFKTNRVGQFVTPWEIILIADEDMGYSVTGRITNILSSTQIVVRDALYFEAGVDYTLSFQIPDANYPATSSSPYKVVRVPAVPTSGDQTIITLSEAFPAGVVAGFSFSLESDLADTGLPKPFRVLTVSEVDGNADHIEIQAIEVNRSKYQYVDTAVDPGELQYSSLSSIYTIPGPSEVGFEETFDRFTTSYLLYVRPQLNRRNYKLYNGQFDIYSRLDGDVTWQLRQTNADGAVVNHPPGYHEFRVTPRNIFGNTAEVNQVSSFYFDVSNPSDPPPAPTNLRVIGSDLVWDYEEPPIDFAGFEFAYRTDLNTKWEGSHPLHTGLVAASPYPMTFIPPTAKLILVRAVDWFGIPSTTFSVTGVNAGDFDIANILWTYDFKAAGWPGTINNGAINSFEILADSDGSVMYSGIGNMYSSTPGSTLMYASEYLAMTYTSEIVKIPDDGRMTFAQDIVGGGVTIQYRQRGTTPMFSGSGNFYKGVGTDPMYTDIEAWTTFISAIDIVAGHWQFRVLTEAGAIRGQVIDLAVTIDVEDIQEDLVDVAIGVAGTRLPITKEYREILVVRPTLKDDGGSAAFVKYVDKDPVLGPLIKVFDVNGNPTTGVVDAYVKGW